MINNTLILFNFCVTNKDLTIYLFTLIKGVYNLFYGTYNVNGVYMFLLLNINNHPISPHIRIVVSPISWS